MTTTDQPAIALPPELRQRIAALRAAQDANIHDLPKACDPVAGGVPIGEPAPTEADVVEAAVSLLEVHWVRDEDDRPPVPKHAFKKLYSHVPADPQVRQRSAKDFDLTEPFVYRGERHPDDVDPPTWVVAEKPESTDFASIPGFLTWLIPRYGRHTMAALIHDHLQDLLVDDPAATPMRHGQPTVTSTEADFIMRSAMRDLGVPFVMRWIVWTGISMRTLVLTPSSGPDAAPRRRVHPYYAAVVGLWVLLYGVGLGVLGAGWLVTQPVVRLSGGQPLAVHPLVVVALLLSPFLLSLLWLPRWRTGVIAAYTVAGVAMPVVWIFVARTLYWCAEGLAKLRPRYTVPVGDELVVFDHNPIGESAWIEQRPERDDKLNQTTAVADGVVIDLAADGGAPPHPPLAEPEPTS